MKFHQNMEKIYSGSSTKLWGNWKQKGMLLLQSLPSLPAQTCHITGCTNLVWEGTWGTSRAQRTFCSLAAPCASHPNVLSYLARVSYASSCQQQAFTGFLWYLPSWLEAPCVFTTFLGCHHSPRWQMVLLSAARAQNLQPCLGSAWCSLCWSPVKNVTGFSTVLTAQLQEMC